MMLGITTYLVFKFLHVLLAIIAVSFNASYAILLSRAAKEPEHEGHVLRTVKAVGPGPGGVIIGALGAIDDMTVTQSSAVAELAAADPQADRGALFRSGQRIGRDHVSSTVNTLFLAYVGPSLPLLLLFILTDQSPWFVAKREFVATEIVRALVGSISLVASVPLTTWLAAYCFALRETKPLPPESDEGKCPGRARRAGKAASHDGRGGSGRIGARGASHSR